MLIEIRRIFESSLTAMNKDTNYDIIHYDPRKHREAAIKALVSSYDIHVYFSQLNPEDRVLQASSTLDSGLFSVVAMYKGEVVAVMVISDWVIFRHETKTSTSPMTTRRWYRQRKALLEPMFVATEQFFEENGIDPKDVFYVDYVGVSPKHTGSGLSKGLFWAILPLSLEHGYKCGVDVAVHPVTSKMHKKVDAVIIAERSYNDFEFEGEFPFKNAALHQNHPVRINFFGFKPNLKFSGTAKL